MITDSTTTDRPGLIGRVRNPSATTVVVVVITLVAFVLRLYRLTRPGQLHGMIGYDDGVYFGASLQLVHGVLPYQDFVFVHPPLLPIIMSPFALLTKVGASTSTAFAFGRLFTVLVSTACVPLLGRLVRHRGTVTVAIACAILALHSDSVSSGHSVFLEPYLVIFCVGGLLAIFDGDRFTESNRRLVVGGVLLGLAAAVKVFAIAPIIVVLLVALPRPRRALRILLGTVAGFVVPCLPFLIASPIAFWRDTVISQLSRTAARTAADERLSNLMGFNDISALERSGARVIAVVAALVVAAAYVLVCRREQRGLVPLEVFAIAAALATLAMFLVSDQFFWHYAAFFAPFAALVVALPTAPLLGSRTTRVGWGLVAAVTVLGLAVGAVHQFETPVTRRVPVALLKHVIPPGACVATNEVSLTISIDRYVAGKHCAVFVDGLGTNFVLGKGRFGQHAVRYPDVRRAWLRSLRGAQYVAIYRPMLQLMPWKSTVVPYLHEHFRHVRTPYTAVWLWRANPVAG